MSEITIQLATTAGIPHLQTLFREYGNYLSRDPSGAAGICIEDFDHEIAGLPAPYFALLLATINGAPAGSVALKPLDRPDASKPAR